MSIQFYLFAMLVTNVTLLLANSKTHPRHYVARRDFFTGIKASEMSVFDSSEKRLLYRVESKYAFLQTIELVTYPSKQVVGRLRAQLNLLLYNGEFSIRDSQSNQWANGTIKNNYQFVGDLFSINWNGKRITMKQEFGSLTYKFFDGNSEYLLAQFRLRPTSIIWTNKYDVQIFSDKYPDQIYLLGLAVRDYIRTRKSGKGK